MDDRKIDFKTAELAKEKGFDEECLYYYFTKTQSLEFGDYCDRTIPVSPHNGFTYRASAPTQSLLQKWLREKHNIIIVIDWEESDGFFYKLNFNSFYNVSKNNSKSYEDCLEIALFECLNNVPHLHDASLCGYVCSDGEV